jgi:hypothetical protein
MRRTLAATTISLIACTTLLAEPIQLARDGRALLPIHVPNGSDGIQLRPLAATLASYLQRISGAEFKIQERRDSPAIHLAIDPGLGASAQWRERYQIRSSRQGLSIVGASALAVQHAAWDLLHRLGWRQYFPGPHWEIVPNRPTIERATRWQATHHSASSRQGRSLSHRCQRRLGSDGGHLARWTTYDLEDEP